MLILLVLLFLLFSYVSSLCPSLSTPTRTISKGGVIYIRTDFCSAFNKSGYHGFDSFKLQSIYTNTPDSFQVIIDNYAGDRKLYDSGIVSDCLDKTIAEYNHYEELLYIGLYCKKLRIFMQFKDRLYWLLCLLGC